MHILSIQSQMVFGHVGSSAAAFPLRTLGHEVWAVPTIVASNHPGYPDFEAHRFDAETVAALLNGIERRGAFADCDLVISGYLGARDIGEVIVDTVARVRAARGSSLYCCDPVMGDRDTGLYVHADIAEWIRTSAVPAADLLTPNLFELEILSAMDPGTLDGAPLGDIVAAARALCARLRPGGRIMVTSVDHREHDPGHIAILAVSADEAWIVETPRFAFDVAPHGAGDLAGALFGVSCARGDSMDAALAFVANTLHAIFSETSKSGGSEMELVAARAVIVCPLQRFVARAVI